MLGPSQTAENARTVFFGVERNKRWFTETEDHEGARKNKSWDVYCESLKQNDNYIYNYNLQLRCECPELPILSGCGDLITWGANTFLKVMREIKRNGKRYRRVEA